MIKKSKQPTLSSIKTGSFERRLSLTKTGLIAGTRFAGHMTAGLFSSKQKRAEKRSKLLSEQANFLVEELGKLKGSVVKIGQMMALYGEHFLPVEVTEALHTLEEHTTAMDWAIIRGVLYEQLGAQHMDELDIEEVPIGAASLGQVHCATLRATGERICLKVQYPGVADAVDADLDAVAQLLKLARVVTLGPAFDDWLQEVRVMMHREVDYLLEARTTKHFAALLKDDCRFVVPTVYPQYSSPRVLATSYEAGETLVSERVAQLPQARRSALAKASLSLFLQELYVWHEIQTDPNFGNYRIRIADAEAGEERGDQIVLLDFGAVQAYPPSFIDPVCSMINAAFEKDLETVIAGGVALNFMQAEWPRSVLEQFGEICIAVLEPLSVTDCRELPEAFNAEGEYCWAKSDLPARIAKRAARSAINRYFKIPPKEFVFLNRKLIGVYTFISVLEAEFNGRSLLAPYVHSSPH